MKLPVLPPWLNLHTLSAVIIAALMIYIGVQKISLLQCKLQSEKLTSQLQKLSDAKNQQKQTTARTITETRVIIRDGNKAAEKIEKAPTAPNCSTPPEIMGADL